MGSIVRRGTRDNPKYFIKYREADGTQRMKLSKQPTKELAKELLADVEARLRRGQSAFATKDRSDHRAADLMDAFAASIVSFDYGCSEWGGASSVRERGRRLLV